MTTGVGEYIMINMNNVKILSQLYVHISKNRIIVNFVRNCVTKDI